MTVLDGNNQPVRQGTIGEVCLRGPNVTRGYLNRPEANKEVNITAHASSCAATGSNLVLSAPPHACL